MKKVLLVSSLLLGMASTASAQSTFTGWFVGGEVHSTKHNYSIPYSELGYTTEGNFTASGSRSAGVGVLGGYGFDFFGDFVGQAELKVRSGGSKSYNDNGERVLKENFGVSISYLQGYRVMNNFLPYVKVGINASHFDINEDALGSGIYVENNSARGFGIGVGLKYAVTNNIEVGAEWHKSFLEAENDMEFDVTSISLNVTYRF